MKGRIDRDGWLYVGRAGYEKAQLCPFGYTGEIRCGDWCPHFGEPAPVWEGAKTKIEICHGRCLIFDKRGLTDERL